MKVEVQNYIVEGAGHFPTDMLRYEGAYPYNESQSGLIDNSRFLPHRKVKLSRAIGSRADKPCAGRWQSFGWRVIEIDGEPCYEA
jgi:hypothetical protein